MNMRIVLVVMLLTLFLAVSAQQKVTGYQYWVDGQVPSTVSINPTSDFRLQTDLPMLGTEPGLHIFHIRFIDDSMQYSSVLSKFFYRSAEPISGYEYWFDDDYNNRIYQSTSATQVFTLNQDLVSNNLNPGLHVFHIRMESNNQWSTVKSRYVYKAGTSTTSGGIIGYRYWFDNNDTTIVDIALPSPTLTYNLPSLNTTALTPDIHILHIQFKDTLGVWSAVLTDTFNNCILLPPVANFQFATSQNTVAFLNSSTNIAYARWDFGDGTQLDSIINPVHIYNYGSYNACLYVKNGCLSAVSDTICKDILIRGVGAIHPTSGGNTGFVTISVNGGGFVPGMQFWLSRNGHTPIFGDTVFVNNPGLMGSTFDLQGQPTGLWDVLVVYPSGDTIILDTVFRIEPGSENLSIQLTGPNVVRQGITTFYAITIANNGNIDAIGVPFAITGLPALTNIKLLNVDSVDISQNPILDSIGIAFDSIPLWAEIIDSSTNTSMYAALIYKIPASSSITLSAYVTVPVNSALLNSRESIQAHVGTPWGEEVWAMKQPLSPTAAECIEDMLIYTGDKIINSIADRSDFLRCTRTVGSSIVSVLDWFGDIGRKREMSQGVAVTTTMFDFAAINYGMVNLVQDCSGTAIDLGLLKYKLFVTGVELAIDGLRNIDRIANCSQALLANDSSRLPITIGNSWDPNQKYGSGADSDGHFIVGDIPLVYLVTFENESAASLPAQKVIVIDTLDISKVDVSTFGFNSFTIADSAFSISGNPQAFTQEVFLPAQGVSCRVLGTLDTSQGIVYLLFTTIDIQTGQETRDATSGFLPPNIVAPQGEGSFTYQISKLPTTSDMDSIENTAYIYFDNNPPIVTQRWVNRIDTIAPESFLFEPIRISNDTWSFKWAGSDNFSGIRAYDIFYKKDAGAWTQWITAGLHDTLHYISLDSAAHYSFYSIAIDSAGNFETPPIQPDVQIYSTSVATLNVGMFSWQCFPNPTEDILNIKMVLSEISTVNIKIFNIYGETVKVLEESQASVHLSSAYDISELNSGIYFIQLTVNGISSIKKIIIQN